jgi:4-amino-4-deoxy-L-arabinose transferase-like glycosyltransferase
MDRRRPSRYDKRCQESVPIVSTTLNRKDVTFGLAAILLIAFLLRVWGIWFGLPFSFRADEYHEVFRALELGSGGFNLERTGKGGYFYILFVEYGVLFVALKLGGIVASAQDFAKYFVRDPTLFYLAGRATTAIIGTVNVLLAYRLGYRAYGVGAASLAAIFLSVDFLSTEHSHFITVDVPMTCLATAALLFAVRLATDGKPSDYRWAALFAALTTTTKLPGILLLAPLLIAHFYYLRARGEGMRQFFLSRNLWWSVVIFVIALLVTNPGLIVHPPVERLGITTDLVAGAEIDADAEMDTDDEAEMLLNVPSNLFVYYFFVIAGSMGWLLLLVAIAGVVYAAWRRTVADVILISYAALNFVVFSSTESLQYYPRYMLPVIVVLALLAGRAVHAAWPRDGSVRQAMAVLLAGLLVAYPTYQSIQNNYLLTQTDTRALAKTWFDDNVEEGSKVMIEGLKVEPSGLTVPLRDTHENMRAKIDFYKKREPAKAKYLSFLVQVDRGKTFDLELVKRSDLQSLDYYKDKGVRYLVIRPQTLEQSRKVGASGRDLLDELRDDPDVEVIQSFRGDRRTRPGPDIDIYEVRTLAQPSSP